MPDVVIGSGVRDGPSSSERNYNCGRIFEMPEDMAARRGAGSLGVLARRWESLTEKASSKNFVQDNTANQRHPATEKEYPERRRAATKRQSEGGRAHHELVELRQLQRRRRPTMSFFKVTLIRSGIGMPEKKLGVLKALGLRKRMRTVFHKITPSTAGQLMKVKELIAVSTAPKKLTRREIHENRRPPTGFVVEKSRFMAPKGDA
ncbi:hypothetical protein H072_6546 [Dactylellina haptotyla CBS 200.50]|uniref:Large ribosomal subunit protein uL30m n=1 Tax=Dactylellina haptotyla (strain CBS 200.50) TaxID=1284197 RepID=S8A9H2_DACHA|nr:hypothetical protein H072_6546 [Dactylellina haptotyla CBS 200.50]